MSEHLILIDGSAFIHRAFHALPRYERLDDRMNINSVKGYCEILWSLTRKNIKGYQGWTGTHMAVVFDHKSPNHRHRLWPAYKANRPPIDPELRAQLPLIRDATKAFGILSIEMEGVEADDIIATLARKAAEDGIDVTIVSSDKDLKQIVGPLIVMWDPLKPVPPEERRTYQFARIDADQVYQKHGVYPSEMGDFLALLGDRADNIPGVPGIGEKTAAQMIEAHRTIAGIYESLATFPPKRRALLEEHRNQLMLSRKLVELVTDVDVSLDWSRATIRLPDRVRVARFLRSQSLKAMLGAVDDFIRDQPRNFRRSA